MFALLNRFAWIISIIFGISVSFFTGRDGLFDEVGFWVFLITMLIVRYLIISPSFIKDRLEFFANSIGKNYTNKLLNGEILNSEGKDINKNEKIIDLKEQEEKDIKNAKLLEEIKLKKEEERQNIINVNKAYAESVKIEKLEETIVQDKIVEEPSKLSLAIKAFFSENLLAKLGGILVFMGVLFFLSLVYSAIGPVGKLIIGFTVGFSIFLIGIWLDKKDLENEGRILIGIGILINYLVILSGRYLIGDSVNNNILTVSTTFLFLIINTVFAVVTSLVYKSRTLLLFSFLFAFINPLLIGGNSDNPYTLVGYSLIVAFGGLYLSNKNKDILLTIGIFILSNILFIIAPMSSDIHWIVKLIGSTIISISTILIVYKIDSNKLSSIFIGSYIFLILLLGSGNIYIKETTSFISYMVTILLYFSIGIYYFLKTSFNSLIYVLLSPILIILGLSFSGDIFSIPLSLAIIVLIYLVGFNFIQSKLPNTLKYVFLIILGLYIFFTNGLISINQINIDLASFITVIIISFVFIFTSYYLSTKKNLEFLYSIGTIGGILTLAPILISKIPNTDNIVDINFSTLGTLTTTNIYLSVIAIIIFAVSNWILPFINTNLIEKNNTKNLIIGSITGLLFIGYQLFSYGNSYFPGVTLGFAFAILAIVYFIIAYLMMDKIGIEKVKKDDSSKNVIYSYLAISISVFSLAIALIFSNYESIISSIWLFQVTIMFYFFNKTKENKIYIAGIILFLIGIIKLFTLIDLVHSKDFIFLIPFSLIAISLVLNLKFLNSIKETETRIFHDILHILGIGILGILLLEIIPNTGHGWSILGITIFITISSIIYSYFNSKTLKIFFILGFAGFLLLQIGQFDSIIGKLKRDNLEYLVILQYISTALLGSAIIAWNKINKQKSLNNIINIIFGIYLLIITSIYVYNIFNSTFAVTIYWGVTSSIILFYGIAKDIVKLRTIGLYLISLTTLKIFLYDIWYGLDDAISRVAALIILGILFIIISTRYTKKYGNNIVGELSFENLKNNSIKSENKKTEENDNLKMKENIDNKIKKEKKSENDYLVNQEIKDIDVSNIKSIKLIFSDKTINIRAVNLIKISKIIIDNNGKNKFKKGELESTYNFIKENYKSELSKDNYNKILDIVKKFVKEGGEIKLIEK